MSENIIITGASRGIGRAIAIKYAQMGCQLFLICKKNMQLLEQLKQELESSFSISCHIFCADVGNIDEVSQVFKEIYQYTNRIDVLINNAGISYIGLLTDMSSSQWQTMINTNLSSLFYCSKEVIPSMLAAKSGHIINISSVWGNVGASCEVAYSATKGGVNSFTKALAKELAPSNIQVNAIACGVIDTDMNHFLEEEEKMALIDEIPACRMGQPEEVAALAYTISSGPSYLTGQIITLDGGWM